MGLITLLASGLALTFILYILLPFAVVTLWRKKFLAKIRKSGYVCLTFDDGPCPKTTPPILALLKQYGIHATFFLIGEKAAKYPDLVNKIIADGHEVGEHSYSHSHPWKCSPARAAIDLIKGGQALKHVQTPRRSICFRPPYGKFNLFTLIYVRTTRKRVAFWDIDPKDYRAYSGHTVAQKVIDQFHPGAVILLHDGRHGLHGSPMQVTVTATQLILEAAARSRMRFAKIGEALSYSMIRGRNEKKPQATW
jgi:peptidoglycan/xylan/chitin deacetylase (PgdA/CDA1 family)